MYRPLATAAAVLVATSGTASAEPVRAPTAELAGGVVVGDTPMRPALGLRAGAQLDRVSLLLGVDGHQLGDNAADARREETRVRTCVDVVVREPVSGPTYVRFRIGIGVERTKVVETFSFPLSTIDMRTDIAYRPTAEGAVGLAHDVGRVSLAAEFGLSETGAASARFDAIVLALVGARF